MVVPRYMLKKASPEAREIMRRAFPEGKIVEDRVVGMREIEIDNIFKLEAILENPSLRVCQ